MPRDWNPILLQSAAQGDWRELKRAVEAGANVNACDEQGVTILMHVVGRGNDLETVKYLVERGANVSARDQAGRTVLDHLTFPPEPPENWENEHEAWTHSEEYFIRDYLEQMGARRSRVEQESLATLVEAMPQTAPPTARAVIPQQDPRACDWDWMLFAAIQHGDLADVESIIATDKVNINARDKSGWTPLTRAVAGNQIEIVRLLLESGADPTIPGKKGTTALSIASPEAKAVLEEF